MPINPRYEASQSPDESGRLREYARAVAKQASGVLDLEPLTIEPERQSAARGLFGIRKKSVNFSPQVFVDGWKIWSILRHKEMRREAGVLKVLEYHLWLGPHGDIIFANTEYAKYTRESDGWLHRKDWQRLAEDDDIAQADQSWQRFKHGDVSGFDYGVDNPRVDKWGLTVYRSLRRIENRALGVR